MSTLQLPLSLGCLGLPGFQKYSWAVVLVTVIWWVSQIPNNPVVTFETALLGSYSKLSNLVFRGPHSNINITILTVQVWRPMTATLAESNSISPYTLLCGKPLLPR